VDALKELLMNYDDFEEKVQNNDLYEVTGTLVTLDETGVKLLQNFAGPVDNISIQDDTPVYGGRFEIGYASLRPIGRDIKVDITLIKASPERLNIETLAFPMHAVPRFEKQSDGSWLIAAIEMVSEGHFDQRIDPLKAC
jgi:hypothetical protein